MSVSDREVAKDADVTAGLVEEAQDASGLQGAEARRPGRIFRAALVAAAPHLSYLLLAVAVTGRLWVHRDIRLVAANPTDHQQFLWFLGNTAYALAHGENPLLTDRLNVPGQANLMANTSILGLGIPLSPITLLVGSTATFIVALILTLAGTASSWYWLLSRHVVPSRLAAYVGAGFCGFGPGMIAQAGGHPNLTAQFLVPLIVWRLIALRNGGHAVRNGIILGLLITYQAFLNEEVLLLTAVACALFLCAYAVQRWSEVRGQVRPFLAGMLVAALTAGALLAYPLWVQFFGPGHYRGLPPGVDRFTTDLASYPAFARRTLAGSDAAARQVTMSANEETFLGWPLLIFIVAAVVMLWRRPVVRALAATGLAFALLSLGPSITVHGHKTHIPGPLRVLRHIPPFELATATRYALVVGPVVGVLLAIAIAALLNWAARDRARQVLAVVAVGLALLPIAPKPLQVIDKPVPRFILSGQWRQYVDGDHSLVSVPLPRNDQMQGMRWAGLANAGFRIPRGYFIGPRSATDPRASYYPALRPTSSLLAVVAQTGRVPKITDADRAAARADLRYWQAAVVVVAGRERHADALVTTVTSLIGPGVWDEDGEVWLWDVRTLTG
jgi:hypothetical protein